MSSPRAGLSYAKVRALTRIATPDTERGLAEIAGPMTGNQLERFARAHRQVSHADDATAQIRRRLAWRFEDDGSLAGTFRLPPLAGAVLLQALRAAAGERPDLTREPALRRFGRAIVLLSEAMWPVPPEDAPQDWRGDPLRTHPAVTPRHGLDQAGIQAVPDLIVSRCVGSLLWRAGR